MCRSGERDSSSCALACFCPTPGQTRPCSSPRGGFISLSDTTTRPFFPGHCTFRKGGGPRRARRTNHIDTPPFRVVELSGWFCVNWRNAQQKTGVSSSSSESGLYTGSNLHEDDSQQKGICAPALAGRRGQEWCPRTADLCHRHQARPGCSDA